MNNVEEQGFLADIVESPDDDVPRLIFADWLEDQGRTDQAELVRVQIQLARLSAKEEEEEEEKDADRKALLQGRELQLKARAAKGLAGRWLRRTMHISQGGAWPGAWSAAWSSA
jgi:uncharacterized protein (TIGR02996 family)